MPIVDETTRRSRSLEVTADGRLKVSGGGGGGGGATTFAALTDKTTVDLPGINTPLASALSAKADASAVTSALAAKADTSALSAKADLASPALTGNPTAPTQTAGDNSTKLATTAYADTSAAAAAAVALAGVPVTTPYSDPAGFWGGPTGITVDAAGASYISGDPCVVWDGTQYVCFFFRTISGSPYVKCYYRTCATLDGTWSSATEITGMAGYHKPAILVDEFGVPALVGGNYHAYAVYYNNSLPSKEIFHFTASTLTGTWTVGSKVIAKGAANSKDEYNTDTPFALYKDGTIYLWYMGAPNTGVADYATYGYAIRMLRATASDPDGAFTKSYTDVLLPSTSAAWDYGWMGGVQVLRRPSGGYMMVFNAGDTRPGAVATEPNVSRIGYAYADSIDGPWTKDAANPYFSPTSLPSDGIEATNIWRGFLAYDRNLRYWCMFYNTGGGGTEKITLVREGVYDYGYTSQGIPYKVQTLTTSIVQLINSRINLPRGLYRVSYQLNLIASTVPSNPNLDVDTVLRINGTPYRTNRDFVGAFSYQNIDTVLNYIVPVTDTGYVDCTVQVTGGSPVSSSDARRLRVNIQKLK